MNLKNISITEYLENKGIPFSKRGKELITDCLFSNCDEDTKRNELPHLYFDSESGQYHCKKCDSRGNLITLVRHLGNLNETSLSLKTMPKKKIIVDPELVKSYQSNLPPNIRKYLNDRSITDELIAYAKLGWFQNSIIIPIFNKNGEKAFIKFRKDPFSTDDQPKYRLQPGAEACLYGYDSLAEDPEYIVICEGEFDRLVLIGNGIPAITSTAGAGTFKNEWLEELRGIKKIYLCFDRDTAGIKATSKITAEIYKKFPDVEVYQINFPDDMEGKDVTDYFSTYKGDADQFLYKLPVLMRNPNIPERVVKIEKPKNEISFQEWKEILTSNFPDLAFPAEVCAAIAVQILISDITNPFALVLVDVPSSGKTITLNFFGNVKFLSYVTDKFTPASFVSNSANVKKEKLAEIDLLPRLRYKLFMIRDLATLFSKRDDDLSECLGIMTRVLDGEGLCTDSGVHGQRQYVGEFLFMMLAASTPIAPKVWKLMGNLGSRLFFLNMNTRDKNEEELSNQLISTDYKLRERSCRDATTQFMETMWFAHKDGVTWNKNKDDKETLSISVRCAQLLARLRGVINVWKDGLGDNDMDYSYQTPVIEKPDRINQLFYNLARGHALLEGRNYISRDDLKIIIELALDSAPTIRSMLFKKLLDNNGELTTGQVEKKLNCSTPTALKEMKCLQILGLVSINIVNDGEVGNTEKRIVLKPEFNWFMSIECKKLRGVTITEEEQIASDVGFIM
jgi:DNA primase